MEVDINKINENSFLLARYSETITPAIELGLTWVIVFNYTVNAKFEAKENEAQKWVANTGCENCDQKEGIGEWDCWIVIRTLHFCSLNDYSIHSSVRPNNSFEP